MLQLQHTPPPQWTTPGLNPVSIHHMAQPIRGSKHPITAYYSVHRPRKDERLSRPGWLVTYRNKVPPSGVEPGHVTHPSTNRAWRRVTSLIRPTMLPLCHADSNGSHRQSCKCCEVMWLLVEASAISAGDSNDCGDIQCEVGTENNQWVEVRQEAQLSQMDRATLYVSMFMLCFTRYGS